MRSDWKRVPIEEVYLGLYDGPHATPKPVSDGPVFLGIKNITEDGRIDLSDIRHIAEEDFSTWTRRVLPCPNDIVFTYEATLNRYAIIPKGFRGCLGRRLALIRPNPEKIDTQFLFYYFFSEDWRSTISKNMLMGSTVDRIPLTNFPKFEISIPPLSTQHKIAAILSAYDDLIENNTRRIAILEEMAQTLYREWFVHFRFPGHEKKRMVESALGVIPEGWEVVKLGKVALINSSSINKGSEPFEINYVDINSVSTGRINNIEPILFNVAPGRARRIVKHGDIIWSTVRPNRKSYSIILNPIPNLIVSTGFAVISAQCVPYTYLYQALTTDDFVSYLTNHATGSAYPAVNSGDFQDAQILLPPDSILNEFHSFAVNLFDEKQNLHQKNINLKHTRDLLLPRLISGEVDVEGLDLETGEGMTEAAASIEEDVKKSAEAALAGAQMMLWG